MMEEDRNSFGDMSNVYGNGTEPSMFVQRPSSGTCQDISHILTRIFRDEYAKDAIDQNTVRNLTTSRSSKSGYHNQYVEKLEQIQRKWEVVMEDANQIEKHLKEAYSMARENEIVQEERASEECSNYKDLGLPSVKSHLDRHVNSDFLRRLNLIVPHDFIYEEKQPQVSIEDGGTPRYARPTTSSVEKHRKIALEDNYHLIENEDDITTKSEIDILKIEHGEKEKPVKRSVKAAYQKVPTTANGDEKSIWRDLMKPSQRQIERSDLAKLQERADFLKNPRFVPPKPSRRNAKPEQDTSADTLEGIDRCDQRVIEPNPNPVIFTDYKVGKVYEIILALKNITSSSRHLRVVPPASTYFSISHGKFPTSDGLLAPGMSCQYSIQFTPDSLADYDDVLKVETQFCHPLFIPLQARRPPPQLTLSDTFDCGHCLIGGRKVIEFSCTNIGGEGRFCIIPSQKWPSLTHKDVMEGNGQCEVGAFVIQPSMFHLKPNENVTILVTFLPETVKRWKESVTIVCDNCNAKEFLIEGSGEIASVEFVSIEGGLSDYLLNESRDINPGNFVRFSNQNPGTIRTKELEIKNLSSVELEYDWIVNRPVHSSSEHSSLLHKNVEQVGEPPAFQVAPCSGTLAPLETSSFSLSFKPTELRNYHNVARLVLCNVPNSNSQCATASSNVIGTQIELKGYTKPLEVKTYPEALVIDRNIEINQPHELNFRVSNNSPSSCEIVWQAIDDDDCSLRVEPNVIDIDPMREVECYVVCVGKRSGFVRRTLVGDISHSASPVYCHFECSFIGPVVRFIDSHLNFGLVKCKESQSRLIEMKSFSSIESNWAVSPDHSEFLEIEPISGRLDSFGSQVILVKLQPDAECILNEIIEVQVAGGDNCFLEIRGVIQRPEVRFLSSNLDIEDCFVNVPVVKTATMQNLTLFSVQYKWLEVIGNDAEVCSLEFKNTSGTLKPREKLDIEFVMCAKEKLNITELIAVCEVEGMLEPLLLSITAQVKGLKIDFSTPDVSGDSISTGSYKELKLEFGYDVPMSSRPRAVLVLENKSAIASVFSLVVENFDVARAPTPPDKREAGKKGYRNRNRLLLTKKTISNESIGKDPDRFFIEYSSVALAERKGAAFLPIPAQGRIGPFEQIVVEVNAFMDMWGEYNDFLLCKVEGLDTVKIPIHLECVGCPLDFQVSKDQRPIVRFGSHISGGETCCRSLRINNTSPCDIRLDWQSFIVEDDDTQLLDLHVMIGNPFPLLDEDNREVESDEDVPDPLVRVRLSPHEGVECTLPFKMEPKQLIVPAKSHAIATAKLTPMQDSRRPVQVSGYALGYMSLTQKDRFHDRQKFLRCDGVDVQPFSLRVTGSIQPARLIVEPESDNGFVFETLASDLLDTESGYSLRMECFSIRRFIIFNNSGTTIQCSVNLRQPFELLFINDTKLSAGTFTHDLVIKQSDNIKIKVGLQLTHSLITELISDTDNPPLPKDANALESTITRKEVVKSLEFAFANGTKQTYNLKGLIYLPNMSLSSENVDFGTCLIDQERERHILLRNKGKSACYWKVSMDKDYPETSRAAFSISPSEGYLEDDAHHDSKNSQTIKIVFRARQVASYECQITIADTFGWHPVLLKLSGSGSHDQVSEKMVNILT